MSGTVQAVIVFLFLLGWQLARTFNVVSQLFLASPLQIVSPSTLARFTGYIGYYETTTYEIVVAYLLAAAIGIGGGIILARSSYAYNVLEPFIVWGYSIPKIALFPIFLRLFGFSVALPIAYGSITGLFVILINTVTGVREVDKHLLAVSTSLGISRLQKYTKIVFPSIVPPVFSGLRQAVIQIVLGVLVAELVLNTLGVGNLIDNLTYAFDSVGLYFVVSTVSIVMIVINILLLHLESRLSFWRS